jgi:hypothetical protein
MNAIITQPLSASAATRNVYVSRAPVSESATRTVNRTAFVGRAVISGRSPETRDVLH